MWGCLYCAMSDFDTSIIALNLPLDLQNHTINISSMYVFCSCYNSYKWNELFISFLIYSHFPMLCHLAMTKEGLNEKGIMKCSVHFPMLFPMILIKGNNTCKKRHDDVILCHFLQSCCQTLEENSG